MTTRQVFAVGGSVRIEVEEQRPADVQITVMVDGAPWYWLGQGAEYDAELRRFVETMANLLDVPRNEQAFLAGEESMRARAVRVATDEAESWRRGSAPNLERAVAAGDIADAIAVLPSAKAQAIDK